MENKNHSLYENNYYYRKSGKMKCLIQKNIVCVFFYIYIIYIITKKTKKLKILGFSNFKITKHTNF